MAVTPATTGGAAALPLRPSRPEGRRMGPARAVPDELRRTPTTTPSPDLSSRPGCSSAPQQARLLGSPRRAAISPPALGSTPAQGGVDVGLFSGSSAAGLGPYCQEVPRDGMNCRRCIKLMVQLKNEERARVKAQEQLAECRQNNNNAPGGALPRPGTAAAAASRGGPQGEKVSKDSGAALDAGGARAPAGPAEVMAAGVEQEALQQSSLFGQAGQERLERRFEGYRREVELLKGQLREKEAHELKLQERFRRQELEHRKALSEYEEQVAKLICEVQELETRNAALQLGLVGSAESSRPLSSAEASTFAESRTYGAPSTSPGGSERCLSFGTPSERVRTSPSADLAPTPDFLE